MSNTLGYFAVVGCSVMGIIDLSSGSYVWATVQFTLAAINLVVISWT